MNNTRKYITANTLLWIVYIALLAVLLPHTAWAFGKFEPQEGLGPLVAWAAAFSFEAAIAVLTHKLAKHIESTPKRLRGVAQFAYRYINAYALGLIVALGVSVLANLAHAVQFGSEISIFAEWGIPTWVYALAFGAVLPLTSLLFARVLSNVVDSEDVTDPEVDRLNTEIKELRGQLRRAEASAHASEVARAEAETRFAAAGDLMSRLFDGAKRERILAARSTWPQLPATAIAIISDSSPSYVSEVLSQVEVENV